jgi:hypothetical protein
VSAFCRGIFEMLSKSRFHSNIKIVITVIVSCIGEFLLYLFKVMNYVGFKIFYLTSHGSSYKLSFQYLLYACYPISQFQSQNKPPLLCKRR